MLRCFAIVVVASCLTAAGWAQTLPAPLPASEVSKSVARKPAKRSGTPSPSGPCHIGVIPIAGNLFHVEGFVAERVATEGWNLDELVVSRVRAAVPGLAVRRIPFTPEELREHPRSWFGNSSDEIKGFVQRLAGRVTCERYVVVHRRGGNSREFGIGISRRITKAILYAMVHVRVFDGRTFELIKQAPASIEPGSSGPPSIFTSLAGTPGGPYRELDPSAFPASPAHAARDPVLRDGVRALLTASLDNTLPAMLRK